MSVFESPEGCVQWFLPGFYYLGFTVGFVVVVLAAFIERPFIERAGVRRWTLLFAIRAGALVVLVGYVFSVFYCRYMMDYFEVSPESGTLIWLSLALAGFLLSILIKGFYLQSYAMPFGQRIRWSMLIVGGFVSSIIIFLFGFSLLWLRDNLRDAAHRFYGESPDAFWAIRGWTLAISHITAFAVMVIILLSFFRKKNVKESIHNDE